MLAEPRIYNKVAVYRDVFGAEAAWNYFVKSQWSLAYCSPPLGQEIIDHINMTRDEHQTVIYRIVNLCARLEWAVLAVVNSQRGVVRIPFTDVVESILIRLWIRDLDTAFSNRHPKCSAV
jgi:hypothetical protein